MVQARPNLTQITIGVEFSIEPARVKPFFYRACDWRAQGVRLAGKLPGTDSGTAWGPPKKGAGIAPSGRASFPIESFVKRPVRDNLCAVASATPAIIP